MSATTFLRRACARAAVGAAVVAISACDDGSDADDEPSSSESTTTSADASASGTIANAGSGGAGDAGGAGGGDELPDLPPGIMPCDEGDHWPLSLSSETYPLVVHYRGASESPMAEVVLDHLETAWSIEVDDLGFRAPLPDGGACGADDSFDVFLYRGIEECYVDVLSENPSTTWDDWTSYMVVDPWGPYGGDILGSTLAHELNHACQATDDWFDTPIVYEMTSTFIEEVVADEVDVYLDTLEDFQRHPDWALDYDDGYETWYMYGSALYLLYVRDRFFAGDASFAGSMWYRLRSEPELAEPDFADAMDELLLPFESSYLDSVVELARWRWFTGARDDGQHFEEGATFPDTADVPVTILAAGAAAVALEPAPMLTGSAYFSLVPDDEEHIELDVAVDAADPAVRWVVQVVPGSASEADVLDLSGGAARVELDGGTAKTLIVTALPSGPYDPDERTDDRWPATLQITLPGD